MTKMLVRPQMEEQVEEDTREPWQVLFDEWLDAMEHDNITQVTHRLRVAPFYRQYMFDIERMFDTEVPTGPEVIHEGDTEVAYCAMGVMQHIDEIRGPLDPRVIPPDLFGDSLIYKYSLDKEVTEEEVNILRMEYGVPMRQAGISRRRSFAIVRMNNEAKLPFPEIARAIRRFGWHRG